MQKSKEWLTVEDLAGRWQVQPHWIYNNYRKLKVPFSFFGGHLRFHSESIALWERGNRGTA